VEWKELVYSIQNYLSSTFGKTESWLVEDLKQILKIVEPGVGDGQGKSDSGEFTERPQSEDGSKSVLSQPGPTRNQNKDLGELHSKFVGEIFAREVQDFQADVLRKIGDFELETPAPAVNLQFYTKSLTLQNTAKFYKDNIAKDQYTAEVQISQKLPIAHKVPLEKKFKISALTRFDQELFITGTSKGRIKLYKFSDFTAALGQSECMHPCWKSSDAFHQSTITQLCCYTRKNDLKPILISVDVKGKILVSEITGIGGRKSLAPTTLNFLSRHNNCHFGPVKYLADLRQTQFFVSFTPKEPLKIWNNLTEDLSVIVNEYSSNFLEAIEIVHESKGIVMAYGDGVLEFCELEYNRYYTNIVAKSGVLKKSCFNRNHPITNLTLKSTNIREKPYLVLGGLLGAEKTLVLKILDIRTFEE